MARSKGFQRQGKAGVRVRFDYADTFDREVLNARKKAGRIIGKKVVAERIENLIAANKDRIGGGVRTAASRSYRWRKVRGSGALSRRRRQAIRSLVGKDGTLVVFDHAPFAVIQETGGIIRARDKLLRIGDGRRRQRLNDKDTFVTKGGLVMEKKPWKKWQRNPTTGKRIGRKPVQPKPRLIAILRPEVVVPQLPAPARLENIAAKHLAEFRDLFSQYLIEGVR